MWKTKQVTSRPRRRKESLYHCGFPWLFCREQSPYLPNPYSYAHPSLLSTLESTPLKPKPSLTPIPSLFSLAVVATAKFLYLESRKKAKRAEAAAQKLKQANRKANEANKEAKEAQKRGREELGDWEEEDEEEESSEYTSEEEDSDEEVNYRRWCNLWARGKLLGVDGFCEVGVPMLKNVLL